LIVIRDWMGIKVLDVKRMEREREEELYNDPETESELNKHEIAGGISLIEQNPWLESTSLKYQNELIANVELPELFLGFRIELILRVMTFEFDHSPM
jgi:hypothetical protein